MTRMIACAALFAASCLLVAQRPGPAVAQDKKEKNALEKQVAALKQDLNLAERQINALQADVVQLRNANAALKTENVKLDAALKAAKKDDGKDDKTIKSLQTIIDGYRGAGVVHVVILKLKPDSATTEPQSVIDETYSQLSKIKTVRGVWAGKPSSKGTPDASKEYTVALVFVFDDAAGLKTYLNDPVHTKFVDKHLKYWETPLVYDFEPKRVTGP
jgi:hypothetical protein